MILCRIERLEFLDEKELLQQLLQHYSICWATKDKLNLGNEQLCFSYISGGCITFLFLNISTVVGSASPVCSLIRQQTFVQKYNRAAQTQAISTIYTVLTAQEVFFTVLRFWVEVCYLAQELKGVQLDVSSASFRFITPLEKYLKWSADEKMPKMTVILYIQILCVFRDCFTIKATSCFISWTFIMWRSNSLFGFTVEVIRYMYALFPVNLLCVWEGILKSARKQQTPPFKMKATI